jgi:cytochrome c-type protein NapB
MRKLLIPLFALPLALSALLAADPPQTAAAPPAEAISEDHLSLYPGSVFEAPAPAGFARNAKDPGENALLPRPFPEAPPRIPHAIADFEPITLAANACLDCHALDAGAGAPELPPSHRTDLRRAPDRPEQTTTGARWICTSCHVTTSDAKPLRANPASPSWPEEPPGERE